MSNLFIAKPDLSDAATVSAQSEVSSMGVANVQDAELAKRHRTSTAVVSTFYVINLGAESAFDMVSLLATNFDANAKWRIRAAPSAASALSNPDHDSGELTFWPQTGLSSFASVSEVNGLYHTSAPVSAQVIRIDVSNTGNADNFLEVGRLFVSEVFKPTYNPNFGSMTFGYKSQPSNSKTPGGTTFVDEPWRLRQADFLLAFLSKAEAFAQALELDRLKGTSGNLLLVLDPDESTYLHDMIIYGHILRLSPVRYIAHEYFEKPFSFEELK